MPLLSISFITTVSLSLITGAIKYFKENERDPTSKIVLDAFDGLFAGILGNVCHEGYNHIRQKLESLQIIDRNGDIERCSRLALLNALIAFSEASKLHIQTTGWSAKDKNDGQLFLAAAQKYMRDQINSLSALEETSEKLTNNPLTGDHINEQILATKADKRAIQSLKTALAEFALSEFTYRDGHLLYEPLKTWLTSGLPGGHHWFVYYIHEMQANLKKDVPAYCKNASRILIHKHLADIKLLSKNNLELLSNVLTISNEHRDILLRLDNTISTEFKKVRGGIRIANSKLDRLLQVYETTGDTSEKLLSQLIKASLQYNKELKSNSGPYRNLTIADEILAGISQPDKNPDQPLHVSVKNSLGVDLPLLAALDRIWLEEKKQVLLLGEGGMGKTVSLIRLWESFLDPQITKDGILTSPIPIFLSLNEFNTVSEPERKNFIAKRICWHYLGTKADNRKEIDILWRIFKSVPQSDRPTILLLLDGFNEITVDNEQQRHLLLELQELSQKSNSVQVVLTSRFDINFTWARNYQALTLQPLHEKSVRAYLLTRSVEYPNELAVQQILENPMMLTLYANTSEINNDNSQDDFFEFRPNITTQGELIWNFLETQIVKLSSIYGRDSYGLHYNKFLIRHFAPYIAFKIEQAGHYFLTENEMRQTIEEACCYFYNKYFLSAYPEYDLYFHKFNLESLDFAAGAKRYVEISQSLCQDLRLLKRGFRGIEFLHQNFRDFFSAAHVLNELRQSLVSLRSSDILKNRLLPKDIRKLTGEIAGEQHQINLPAPEPTILMKVLSNLRGVYDDERIGLTITNIVAIWKDTRPHLGSADFSNLNLTKATFHNAFCYKKHREFYQSAKFDQSIINENCFVSNGHAGPVVDVDFHPNGTIFISAANDGTIKIWDTQTGQCLHTFDDFEQTIYNISFHPGGDKFVSTYANRSFKIWDLRTRSCSFTYTNPAENEQKTDTPLIFAPDGNSFLFDSSIWNCQDNLPERADEWFPSFGTFHPDGKTFLSRSNVQIFLWNLQTRENLRTFKGLETNGKSDITFEQGHTDTVSALSFHPGGKYFVSGSLDKTIRIWSIDKSDCLFTFKGHTGQITCVEFSPSGESFISGSSDKTIKLWDVETKQCLHTFEGHTAKIKRTRFSPDGKFLVSGSSDSSVRVWDVKSGLCLHVIERPDNTPNVCAFDSLGIRFLSSSNDNTVRLWDTENGLCLDTYTDHSGKVSALAFHPGGKSFISSEEDNTVRLWDIHTNECLRTFEGHSRQVSCLAFHPDGHRFVSGSLDRTVKVWNINNPHFISSANEHKLAISSLAFDSTGVYLFSGSWDTSIIIWDLERAESAGSFYGHTNTVLKIVVDHSSKFLISGSEDRTVRIWDIENVRLVRTLNTLPEVIVDFAFDPNIRHMAYSSREGDIRIWDETNQHWSDFDRINSKRYATTNLDFDANKNNLLAVTNRDSIDIQPIDPDLPPLSIEMQVGLRLTGCSFKDLNVRSQCSDHFKHTMRRHGAIFDQQDHDLLASAIGRMYNGKIELQ